MAFKMRSGNSPLEFKQDRLAAAQRKKCPTCGKMFLIVDDGKGNWDTAAFDAHVASHKTETKKDE